MNEDYAIRTENLTRIFKVYSNPKGRLLEMIVPGKKLFHRKLTALNGIDLNVKPGEAMGLLGMNGAGKSTLLRVLAGLSPYDSGKVDIRGRVSALLDLGAGFNPHFTGRYNIVMNCSLLGLSREEIEEKMDDIIAFSELEDFIDAPMRTYSSGMSMRLGFSVATAIDPDILLVDEVIAVGDEHFQGKCLDTIKELKRGGTTIVLVTHTMGWIKSICDKAVWLKRGEVESEGPPRDVIGDYFAFIRRLEGGETAAASGHARKGTGEAVIENVRFLDGNDRERTAFASGDPLTMEIAYKARRRIEKPTFGFSIETEDRREIFGFASRDDGAGPDFIEGRGTLKIHFPSFSLLRGNYYVTAGILDEQSIKSYDFHERLYSLLITQSSTDSGYCRLEHEYDFVNV